MVFVWCNKNLWKIFGILYFLYESYCLLNSSSRSASSGQDNVLFRICTKRLEKAVKRVMHHLGRKLAKITEFSVRVCHKSLSIFDHGFNRCVGPVSCCMVDINCLQLDVVWAEVPGA